MFCYPCFTERPGIDRIVPLWSRILFPHASATGLFVKGGCLMESALNCDWDSIKLCNGQGLLLWYCNLRRVNCGQPIPIQQNIKLRYYSLRSLLLVHHFQASGYRSHLLVLLRSA